MKLFLSILITLIFSAFISPVSAATQDGCIISGCSSQICSDVAMMSTCEYKQQYACYATATCEKQANGRCGWTQTIELTACLADSDRPVDDTIVMPPRPTNAVRPTRRNTPTAVPLITRRISPSPTIIPTTVTPVTSGCMRTGCSGQVCSDKEMTTTCEYKPSYACYNNARCERQANGACGWTETDSLRSCLAKEQGEELSVGSTITPRPLPQPPAWIHVMPLPVKNLLEMLYIWRTYFGKPTNREALLTQPSPMP